MYLGKLFKTIYRKLWLRYSKRGKEYAKKYKKKRTNELINMIKSKGES